MGQDKGWDAAARFIGQVITVRLETVKLVNALPDLGPLKEATAKTTNAKATTVQ